MWNIYIQFNSCVNKWSRKRKIYRSPLCILRYSSFRSRYDSKRNVAGHEIHVWLNDDTCVRIGMVTPLPARLERGGHNSALSPSSRTNAFPGKVVTDSTLVSWRENSSSSPISSIPLQSSICTIPIARHLGVRYFRRGDRRLEMINKPRYRPVLVSSTVRPIDSKP